MSCTSILVSHAETTSDNLLNNPNFTTDTSGWKLSDNNQDKVKRDPATYSDSASKSVRFRYQGGSISQDVDISGVSENHLIKEINMNFDSIGCGNSGSQWCNAGADDTVVSTITLSTESTSEVLSETVAVPYEDGWESYSFTKDVTADFNTDDTSLNLTITGNDTGNSSNWYGPIIDNLSLTLTTEQYVAPVVIEPIVAPVVIEPVIEPIVVIEETLIEGISLDMSITNDIILNQPIAEITPIEVTVPDINIDMATDPDVPSIETEIPQQIEISVAPITSISVSNVENLAPINEVEEIQEIVEIELPEVVEVEVDAEMELEQPEELKEINMEEDLAEISDEENNNEPEETASNDGNDEKSELSESDVQESSSKKVNESKVVKKDKPKDDKKSKKNDSKKTTVEKQNSTTKSKTVVQKSKQKNQKNTVSVETLGQIILPNAYLQVLQDTIKITETLSIQQEMIYGQNAYDLVGFTFESSFGGDSSDRFNSLLGVKPSYESTTYRRSR